MDSKLEKYDAATKHPKHWLAFLLCCHPIDHFTGRQLSLTSCVPPSIGQPDNVNVLPSADLQRLERSTTGSVSLVSKAPKKRGSEASSFASASTSSFTHTVQLVSQHKEDEELAHIKEHVASIKDAISAMENLDAAEYAEELTNLRKELALAVIDQVRMMKQRTEQNKQIRASESAGDDFANQLVSSASNSVFPRSTPLSAFTSPDADATQYPPVAFNDEAEPEHWIQYENPAQLDKLLYASFKLLLVVLLRGLEYSQI